MALELVLARKAVVAAVSAPDQGAWKLLLVRVGAMLGLVVASEIAKVLGQDLTFLLETRELSGLAVVASLVDKELWDQCIFRGSRTVRKTALAPFTLDVGYGEIVYANSEAADTSAILLGTRIAQQIRSERLRRFISWRDGDCVSALSRGSHFRFSHLQRRGMR